MDWIDESGVLFLLCLSTSYFHLLILVGTDLGRNLLNCLMITLNFVPSSFFRIYSILLNTFQVNLHIYFFGLTYNIII